jgi:hypothetical protein
MLLQKGLRPACGPQSAPRLRPTGRCLVTRAMNEGNEDIDLNFTIQWSQFLLERANQKEMTMATMAERVVDAVAQRPELPSANQMLYNDYMDDHRLITNWHEGAWRSLLPPSQ